MDVKKFLDALARCEWGDGADSVAIDLEKLMETAHELDEESLAMKVFEIYFEDRGRTWEHSKGYLVQKILKLVD